MIPTRILLLLMMRQAQVRTTRFLGGNVIPCDPPAVMVDLNDATEETHVMIDEQLLMANTTH